MAPRARTRTPPRRAHRSGLAAGVTAAALLLAACGEGGDAASEEPTGTSSARPSDDAEPSDATGTAEPTEPSSSSRGPSGGPPEVVGTVASGLEAPWGIAFRPDGSAVVTERDSRRLLLVTPSGGDGEARVEELGVVEQAAPQGEAGLLGVELSPSDPDTVFLYVTTAEDNRVLRGSIAGGRLDDLEPILDGIPNGFIHDGGRLEFGPDGHLYVSTGEVGEDALAQDEDSLAGKVLRITEDGEPAPGNPDPSSPVFSTGHRNVQGLAFDEADRLWASEFGDQTADEVNLIEAGANYGWPEVEGEGGEPEFVDPQWTWPTSEASPSGLAWAGGRLWMGALRGNRLWRMDVTAEGVLAAKSFFVGDYGRLRSVATTPDGDLWVTTSNRDGRGNPAADDDRILLVRP